MPDPVRLILQNRTVIGIAVRHSLLPDDHMTFIDSMEKIGLFEDCARKLASNSPNVAFFIMSDRLETQVHFVQKFGSRAVAIDSPIEHSAFGSKTSFLYTLAEDCNSPWILCPTAHARLSCLRCICPCSYQTYELDRALLWFLFADVDDAVITKMSTFGLTAFARTGRASASAHDGLAFRRRRSISFDGAGAPPQSTRVESATSSAEMPISIDPLKEPSYYTSKATQCVRQAWNFDIDEWGLAGKSSFPLYGSFSWCIVHARRRSTTAALDVSWCNVSTSSFKLITLCRSRSHRGPASIAAKRRPSEPACCITKEGRTI